MEINRALDLPQELSGRLDDRFRDLLSGRGRSMSAGFRVAPDTMALVPTQAELAANNRAYDGPAHWRHISWLLPELADSPPIEVLDAVERRFRENPTHDSARLLQAAVNRITQAPELAREHRDAVVRVKELLASGEGMADTSIVDNLYFEAYEHADFGGAEFFTSMTPGWAYWRVPDFREVRAVYSNVDMHDKISSIEFGSSVQEVGGQVVLFEHTRYDGNYINFTVPPAGGRTRLPWIGSGMNDRASSALIIRRFLNETAPVSVASLLDRQRIVDAVMQMPGVSPAEDPFFSWDMWPIGPRSDVDWHPHDPEQTLIQITVPIRIGSPDPFPATYAQVKYWILPFIRDGRLRATVRWWGYYLEGGLFSDIVKLLLELFIPLSMPRVEGIVNRAVDAANMAGPFRFFYFLPGRNGFTGHIRDDVTVVAVR